MPAILAQEALKITNPKLSDAIACVEPCQVTRCLKTCRHDNGHEGQTHFCSDHDIRVAEFSQQKTLPMNAMQRQFKQWIKPLFANTPQRVTEAALPSKTQTGASEGEDVEPALVDESDSEIDTAPLKGRLIDPSSSDEEEEDEFDYTTLLQMHHNQKQKEELTQRLDFDDVDAGDIMHDETYFVAPSQQLRNLIKTRISQTWEILAAEWTDTQDTQWQLVEDKDVEWPQPDPQMVWWTDHVKNIEQAHEHQLLMPESQIQNPNVKLYYELWRKFDARKWSEPIYSDTLTVFEKTTVISKYGVERFYTETQLPVITPENMSSFIQHLKKHHYDMKSVKKRYWPWWMHQTASHKIGEEGAIILPLIDVIYGWDLKQEKHRNLVLKARDYFQPTMTLIQPLSYAWEKQIERHAFVLRKQRQEEIPLHEFIQDYVQFRTVKPNQTVVFIPSDTQLSTKSPLANLSEHFVRQPVNNSTKWKKVQIVDCVTVIHDTMPALPVEEQAQRAALWQRGETLHSKHLSCPWCSQHFSSPNTLRFHKATQHKDENNEERERKGLPPSKDKKKRTAVPQQQPWKKTKRETAEGTLDEQRVQTEKELQPERSDDQSVSVPATSSVGLQPLQTPSSSSQDTMPTPIGTPFSFGPPQAAAPQPEQQARTPQARKFTQAVRAGRQRIPQARPFAGGIERARRMLGHRLLQGLNPNTNPAETVPASESENMREKDFGERQEEPEIPGPVTSASIPSSSSTAPDTAARESARKKVRRHPHDLDPYPDDFFAHLTAEDIPDWNTDDLLIGGDADLPPEARKCPVDVRKMIRNAHVNLGHPSNHSLVRLMRTAKCHADMVAYARHMKCPSCVRRKPPSRIPRVSLPYRPTRFNAVVGLDLKLVKDSKGDIYYILNILDLATAFNVCCVVPDKTPKSIADAFKHYWMNWAGNPEKVVADKGTEYYTDFQHMLSDLGIAYRLVPVEAPWQHGMVERHGQVLADIVNIVVSDLGVAGWQQMQDLCLHVCMVKNRRPGRTGYSPRTLIFGVDERLVASGLNHYLEEPDDASIEAAHENPVFKQSMQIRKSAMKALIDLDHSEKWRDAIKFPSRKAECAMFLPGHQVFFWKKSPTGANLKGRRARLIERWFGPGVVIGHEWDQTAERDSYWVSYGGKCFLVAGTHMRHAEFEECFSHEEFVKEMQRAFDNVQTPTFQYSDVRRDQASPDEVIGQRLGGTRSR